MRETIDQILDQLEAEEAAYVASAANQRAQQGFAVHYGSYGIPFESSADAYNSSQSSDAVATGDILIVACEGNAAVLVGFNPVVAAGPRGSFDAFDVGYGPDIDGGRYEEAFLAAAALIAGLKESG